MRDLRRRLGIPPWWLWLLGLLYMGIMPDVVAFMMGPIGYWVGMIMGIALFLFYSLIWAQTRDNGGD